MLFQHSILHRTMLYNVALAQRKLLRLSADATRKLALT